MSKHILIVDDEPKVAFFLSKALERLNQNYRVSVAHSGEEALQVLDGPPVDLLITDLRMPGISGLDLIRQVRAASPQTRTILITAYGSDKVETEARRLAYRYITKPFGIGEFAQAVEEALCDEAIGRPGLVVLSDEAFEAIVQQLEDLRRDVGASCIFLADMQGQCLARTGNTEGIDAVTLLALLGGGFAAGGELARRFGNGQAANLNFHEGSRYDIYSASVGDDLFLAIIYNRQMQSSRIGTVWLYTRRAVKGLLSTISTAETAAPAQILDSDFGSSLMTEMDTLFTEETASDSPVQETAERGESGNSVSRAAPSREGVEEKHTDEDEPEQELFDLKTAIEHGIIPPGFIE